MITIRSINGEVLTHFDNDVPNGNPYFEPVMTDDMESLVSSFSFSVPLQLADTEYLTGMNQVLTYDRQGDLRLFIISDVYEDWNTTNGVVKVDCEDVSITEMNNIVVNPFEAKDFNEALTKTFKNSGWKFKFAANWREVIHDTFILEDYTNMRDVLAQLKDTYKCQFKFMAQENEYGEITRVVEVFKSVGNDNGKYFYYNRDLLGIERDISFTDVKTAIHPYYVGYNGKVYTLANFAPAHPDPDFSKDKESPLIVNKAAHAEYDDGNSYRIMPYKTEVQGDPELVYREAIEELKKHAEPIYTYTVNALLLQNMIEWEGEDIDLGDTVWMKERVGNRELGLEARVVAYEYHEDDPSADKVTFSNFKEIDTRDVEELSNRIFFAYANSADGHLDFSTDDSVGKAYMGVYTSTVTQQSTDPDTYKWTRIKGEDGNSAPTLSLTTSQQVMKFRPDGTPDGDQTILFTAVKQNSTEAVEWEAIPYRGEAEQPAITLEGPGDTRTLSRAHWDRPWTRGQVPVPLGALKDIQTVVQVADGATGASGKAIVGFVTNESTTFAASTNGTVSDYTQGNGKFVIYDGTKEVTSGVLYAKESNVGINLVIDATTGEYTVANMTQDQAQAVVKATYKGVTITKFLSFAKSKQGAKGDKGDTGRDGIAGKDGVGLRSTAVTYAASTSGTTSPATGWQEQVPTVAPDNFLWTRTIWTYSDGTSETGYSVAKMGRDGAKGDDGIAGKDGVGIADTLIEYAVSTSGTTRPTSGWSTTIPTTPQGQYLWTRTTWTYTDSTTEQGFTVARQGEKGDKGDRGNDGIAGKDGVGLRSTSVTYAKHTTASTPPSTGWQEQVPTVPAGQYLWTKTVWNYTDSTSETGYSVARMGQDGAKGDDGIAGKDGVGLRSTSVTYAGSANGTTPPSTGWNTKVPTVPAGQYLWTKTVWTYTDSSSETGYSVARMGQNGNNGKDGIAGKDGVGIKTTVIEYAVNTSGTTRPSSGWSTSIPTVPQGQYLWTRTTWTYTDNTTEQGFTVARQGSNGANGTNGTNGANAISAFLSNETVSLPANAAGVVSSFATAKGTMMVYEGLNRVTSGVTFALGAHNNTTATVDASGNFAVTAMTADSATVVINATYKGKTISKTFSLSKAKQGVQGVQGTMGIAFYSPTEPTGATVTNGATWFKTKSASDDTVIGIYTRKSGAWKQTPLASGTLAVEQLSAISANIGNVTAGNLTGVKITGASFINPFDFTDQTNNHIQGTTEISNSELDISGTANAGTAGERKFHTTVAPLYFEATYSDAADNLIRSLNMSSSGFILNEVGNRVTTSLSSGQFQAIDNAKGKSVITSTNNINITDSKNTAVMSPSGFVFRNRKNIHLWQGTGTNVKSMPNLGRITFGTYQSVGWGMLNEDIPLRVHNSYTWQAKRKIKLEIIAQVNIQDASSDWVYFTAQFGTTTATDKSPRQIIPIGRISATKDSGDNRIPLQNTILCTGYFELNEGEYLSLCGNCRNGKNCGNVTGMSITFREIFST